MTDNPHSEMFRADELRIVTDATPVEHIGGPDDGEMRPICENGARTSGMYVVVNGADGQTTAKRFLPDQ